MARGGFEDSEARIRGAMRFPRLFLSQGDRARFHFLADGGPGDPYLLSARFHSVPVPDRQWGREVICLDSLTDGEEICPLCQAGNTEMVSRFGVWGYVHFILHTGDNPDEESTPWKQVKVDGRIMFKETVDQPLLIRMGIGKEMAWFGQFKAMWTKYGTLLDRLYELKRTGSKLDTEYHLEMSKEISLPAEKAKTAREAIVPVEDVFRATLGGTRQLAAMAEGADELEPEEGDLEPAPEPEEEEDEML